MMNLITREELQTKLKTEDEFKLVMTLDTPAYKTKHIPGSLCVESVAEALELLDRDDEIVVYCADVYCASSIYAYYALEREGYRRIRRYAGGVADWEGAGNTLTGKTSRPRRRKNPVPKPHRLSTAHRPWRVCF
jgi:3-mercaptopyruvate sulfurtransferase SseA